MSAANPEPQSDGGLGPFDEEFLRKLELLSVVSKRLLSGQFKAERRARKVGAGVEFADYRGYVPGDDFRAVDWRAYMRLDRLILRLFEEETDLPIYLFVDASRSMGTDGGKKLDYAKKVAAALAYIGLSNLDRVNLVVFAEGIIEELPAQRAKGQIFSILRFLSRVQASHETNAGEAFHRFFTAKRRRGMTVAISDFFDPHGATKAFDIVRYRRQDLLAVHVASPQDMSPRLNGEVTLIDSETRQPQDVTVTPTLLQAYEEEYDRYCDELERYCTLYGFSYVRTITEHPFEDLILQVMRQGRVLS